MYKKRIAAPIKVETKTPASEQDKREFPQIKENIEYIRTQLPANTSLIAVSKTMAAERVRFAHTFAGQCDFGENKVQELLQKAEALADLKGLRWHFLGHLQKNKIKPLLRVSGLVLLHSLDSLSLAEKLNYHLALTSRQLNVLIQVNTSQEENKYGCRPEEALSLAQKIALDMPHLHIQGLMTIAKLGADPEENKACFQILRELKAEIKKRKIANTAMDMLSMDILSMGMSSDYKAALSQGSTMVRIGQGIFGIRKN